MPARTDFEGGSGARRHVASDGDEPAQLPFQLGNPGGQSPPLVELDLRLERGLLDPLDGREHRREVDALQDDDAAAPALDHPATSAGGTVDHQAVGLEPADVTADGAGIAAALVGEVLHARRRDRPIGILGDITQQRMAGHKDRVRQAVSDGRQAQDTVKLPLREPGFDGLLFLHS